MLAAVVPPALHPLDLQLAVGDQVACVSVQDNGEISVSSDSC